MPSTQTSPSEKGNIPIQSPLLILMHFHVIKGEKRKGMAVLGKIAIRIGKTTILWIIDLSMYCDAGGTL